MLETITSSTDISDLFENGRRFSNPFLTILVKKRTHGRSGRVAFVAGKKLGNAVWRNKNKRRMRAVCKEMQGPWVNYDVVFIAKPQTSQASYSKVLSACKELLAKAGLE